MSSQPPPPPSGPFGPPPGPAPYPGQPFPGQPAPPIPGPGTPRPYPDVPPPSYDPPPPGPGGPGFGGPPGPGGPGYGGGPGGPGGPGVPGGPGFGGQAFGGPPKKQRGALWIAIGVVVALAAGGGVYLALSGDDDDDPTTDGPGPDGSSIAPITLPATTIEAATTAPETTVVETTQAATTLPATTAAPVTLPPITTAPPDTTAPLDPNAVDLGHGVSFQLPAGYTQEQFEDGVSTQLTDGTVTAFFQVLVREPGESPVALLQEYIDSFDQNFASVVYTQVVPSAPVDVGAAISDSNLVVYRALNADGSGVKGFIDANRRADGLSYVSDIFVPISDTTNAVFPNDSLNEMFNSYLEAPLIADAVELGPLSVTRLNTVHAPLVIDGFVAVTAPPGWTVDLPGPGRVIVSKADGQRFLAEKIPNLTDLGAAQQAAQANVLALVPTATFGAFSDDLEDETKFTSARWGGTDPNTGDPLQGFIAVWFNPTTGEAFEALEAWIGPATDPPSPIEFDFLFQAFDASVVRPHV